MGGPSMSRAVVSAETGASGKTGSVLPALAALVGARSQAVVSAGERVVEVPEALAGLLPDRGLRRGTTVAVGVAEGGSALALALVSTACGQGAWCAAVGLPELGLVAADQLGLRLDRFALVPRPGKQWMVVTAALLDGVDLLLVRPPDWTSAGDARRLVARARERDAVLVVVGPGRWPEAPDLRLDVVASTWTGLERGHGHLQYREVEVAVIGRRAATRERRARFLLPGPDGTISLAPGGQARPEMLVSEIVKRAG